MKIPCTGRIVNPDEMSSQVAEASLLRYFGDKHFVVDRGAKDYVHASWEDLEEFGRVVWIEVDGGVAEAYGD